MWDAYYECVHKKKGTIHVLCRFCRRGCFAHPNKVGSNLLAKGGATTSMARHLEECSAYKKQKPSTQKSISDFSGLNAKKPEEDLLTKTVNFFISGKIAFNQADNLHFHDMIRTATALRTTKLPTINHKNTRQRLTDLASNGKEDLARCLMENESKVSLALDCWTSKNNYAFLGKSPLTPTSFLYQVDHSYYCSLDRQELETS